MSKRKERSPEHLFAVRVYWNNKVLEAEVDTNQPPSVFKSQLFSLTNVLPENQKILIKGNILEDSVDWSTIGMKQGQKLKMMGTAVGIVKSPKEASVNMYPAGLVNLGNSDYINSTIQCLHAVPELHSALNEYEIVLWNKTTRITLTAKRLFNELSSSVKPVSPLPFVRDLCTKYPQYDEMNKDNVPTQQDAEECWIRVLEIFSQTLTSNSTMPVKKIFGIDLVCRVHCAETGEESIEEESVYSVKCNTLYNVNLLEGLNLGLKSKVERVSPKLGHSTVYDKVSSINGLPKYLTVHFDRFIWDKEKNMKEKSLQKVEYPLELDVYELCSDELRKKLEIHRQMSSYKLLAVLSHIGSCPNSGHYIAWVKQESTGQWFSFDDHIVTPVSNEEITKLSGGGDRHMAYICMYKACL